MTTLDSLETEVQRLLELGLRCAIGELNAQYSGAAVYAVAVFCASGYSSFALAANTRDWLEDKLQQEGGASQSARDYCELHVSQWKELNFAYRAFSELNERLDDLLDDMYDAALSDDQISELFTRAVVRAIKAADLGGLVATTCDGPLLLGLQFADPSEREWKAALDVSRDVNSDDWHTRLRSL
ncbi:MAG: DUF4303 domain-containing protein [Pseudomonadota bacterium]